MKNTDTAPSAQDFNVKDSVLWYIVMPLLLSVFISFMLVLQIRLLLRSADDVAHSQAVISKTTMMQKMILDMETSLRGYYITGRKSYLQPYIEAQRQFEPEMDQLKDAIASTGGDVTRADTILMLSKGWLAYSKARIDQRARSHKTPVDEYSEGGKKIMDQIRDNFVAIHHDQEHLISVRKEKVERETKISVTFTVLLSIFLSALLSFVIYRRIRSISNTFNNNLHDLLVAKNQVEEINQNLENTVSERTSDLVAANTELEAFCYSVSHDLRAPLRGIDGFSLALAEDYNDKLDERAKQYITYVRQGVQKMGRLIDDLLNLSRITRAEVQKSRVDLTALFKDVRDDIFKNNSREAVPEFTFEVDDNLSVYGDEGLLRVVLENLLSNAWKFSRKQPHPHVRMGKTEDKGRAVFYIRDNGVGFDMAFKDKLFNAFQRLHSASEYSGTGIGLATVKRVLLKHGGDIWVESTLGKGTTFYFTLPEVPEERNLYEVQQNHRSY